LKLDSSKLKRLLIKRSARASSRKKPPAASATASVTPISASQPAGAVLRLRPIFVRQDSDHRVLPHPAKDYRLEPLRCAALPDSIAGDDLHTA